MKTWEGIKNMLSQLIAQKYAIEQMSASREQAIAALMRPQALGVTDGEYL
jgi:hypothetical protein